MLDVTGTAPVRVVNGQLMVFVLGIKTFETSADSSSRLHARGCTALYSAAGGAGRVNGSSTTLYIIVSFSRSKLTIGGGGNCGHFLYFVRTTSTGGGFLKSRTSRFNGASED